MPVNYTDALIAEYDNKQDYSGLSDQEREAARQEFRKALNSKFDPRTRNTTRTGAIDIINFHRANDKELKELNLLDEMFKEDGKLVGSYIYGKIKEIDKTTYPELVKDLGNLWAAQFKDHLLSVEDKAKKDAEQAEKDRFITELKTETEKRLNDFVERLKADTEIKSLFDKLADPSFGELAMNLDITSGAMIYKPTSWDKEYLRVYISLETNDKVISGVMQDTVHNREDLDEVCSEEAFKEYRDGLIKKLNNKLAEITEKQTRDNLVKKIVGIDIEDDIIIYTRIDNKLYTVSARGNKVKINPDLDIETATLPGELLALTTSSSYEHNIYSVYGHRGYSGETYITEKGLEDKELLDTLDLIKNEKGELEWTYEQGYLESVYFRVEKDQEAYGIKFPVVVHKSITVYND